MTGHDRHLSSETVRVVDIGSGPALVLLHGLGGTWRNWQANLPGLSREHRVIALDLPGFGRSPRYIGPVTMERYVDTVIELLDELDVPSATFVGNSMGGLLTIEAAVRHPRRVRAVVLACSGGIPLTSLRQRLFTIPQARAINQLLQVGLVRRAIKVSPLARNLIGGRILHAPGTIPPDVLSAALRGLGAPGFGPAMAAAAHYDARIRAPQITCPTLVLWGREDRLLPVDMATELHDLIPGSRLIVWDGIGHCPMLEAPDRFDAVVSAFTSETTATTGTHA